MAIKGRPLSIKGTPILPERGQTPRRATGNMGSLRKIVRITCSRRRSGGLLPTGTLKHPFPIPELRGPPARADLATRAAIPAYLPQCTGFVALRSPPANHDPQTGLNKCGCPLCPTNVGVPFVATQQMWVSPLSTNVGVPFVALPLCRPSLCRCPFVVAPLSFVPPFVLARGPKIRKQPVFGLRGPPDVGRQAAGVTTHRVQR